MPKADMTPAAIPDLYRGEPLVLAARLDKLAGSVEIKGRIGDRPWTVTLPLANAAEGKGLSKLWARRKIADAEIARTMRQATPEDADKTILALALEHQLVTRLTSLVAVDKTPSRPDGEPLKLTELPLNLPAGWDFAKVFGERPQSPSLPQLQPGERRADAGDARVQLAMAKRALPAVAPTPNTVTLPKTATDAELKMIAGSILLALSLILLAFNRRQTSLMPDERRSVPNLLLQRARGLPSAQGRARNSLDEASISDQLVLRCSFGCSRSPASCCSARALTSTPRRCSRRCCWSAPSPKPSPAATTQNPGHGRIPGRSRASR